MVPAGTIPRGVRCLVLQPTARDVQSDFFYMMARWGSTGGLFLLLLSSTKSEIGCLLGLVVGYDHLPVVALQAT